MAQHRRDVLEDDPRLWEVGDVANPVAGIERLGRKAHSRLPRDRIGSAGFGPAMVRIGRGSGYILPGVPHTRQASIPGGVRPGSMRLRRCSDASWRVGLL